MKRILLIISGGIAAFKTAELVRLLRRAGYGVTCVLTENAAEFVTPLTLQALSENKVFSSLFSLTDENELLRFLLCVSTSSRLCVKCRS